jgi:hypothetical protein
MRGLFMDFGNDPNVANIRDEYMFGLPSYRSCYGTGKNLS